MALACFFANKIIELQTDLLAIPVSTDERGGCGLGGVTNPTHAYIRYLYYIS